MPHGVSSLDNKPIIITFLAMEKVILLCTIKTSIGRFGSIEKEIFLGNCDNFFEVKANALSTKR